MGWRSARAFVPLLEYLRALGVLPEAEENPLPFDALLARYEGY